MLSSSCLIHFGLFRGRSWGIRSDKSRIQGQEDASRSDSLARQWPLGEIRKKYRGGSFLITHRCGSSLVSCLADSCPGKACMEESGCLCLRFAAWKGTPGYFPSSWDFPAALWWRPDAWPGGGDGSMLLGMVMVQHAQHELFRSHLEFILEHPGWALTECQNQSSHVTQNGAKGPLTA